MEDEEIPVGENRTMEEGNNPFMSTGVDAILLLGSIQHFFLPKKTPQAEQENLFRIEKFIFQGVMQSLEKAIKESKITELTSLISTLQTWRYIQPKPDDSPETFFEKFTALIQSKCIRTIPIYVRNQNSALILHKENDCIRLETFRTVLPTKVVMENRADIFINIPETSNIIQNKTLLQSSGFSKVIYDLIVNDVGISTPPVRKGKKRDPVEPFLVNDWLVGLLAPIDKQDVAEVPFKSSLIRKKVRDQVNLHACEQSSRLSPFRRSGFWMAIKAVIHLIMERFFREPNLAKVFYKTLILDTLTNVYESYFYLWKSQNLDFDLMHQMKANLANRVIKIQTIPSTDNVTPFVNLIESFKNKTFKKVDQLLRTTDKYIIKCLNEEITPKTRQNLPNRSKGEYIGDLLHNIPILSAIRKKFKDIQRELATQKNVKVPDDLQQSLKLQRYTTAELILAGAKDLQYLNCHQLQIWLHDTETFLKVGLVSEPDLLKIFAVAQEYIKKALELYNVDNPLGMSQLVLCFLKTLETLDKRAVEKFPLLKSYTSGVNAKSFQNLLLPYLEDIHLLKNALDYFKNRNKNASISESLLVHKLSKQSFAVKYFDKSLDLKGMLKRVKEKVDDGIKIKIKETQDTIRECNELERKINNIENCSCLYETRTIKDKFGRTSTAQYLVGSRCTRCELRIMLTNKATSVTVFEMPLPDEEFLQKGLIFELYIPAEISILRDILTILQVYLLKEPGYNAISMARSNLNWRQYHNLRNYFDMSKVNTAPKNIIFGSSCTATCLGKPDLRYCSYENMIKENGLNCIYSCSATFYVNSFELSFKIRSMKNSKPYWTLQPYLNSWNHSQNEVICNQSDCHADLTMEEFLAYGSIRAGHRIQLRNLFSKIASNLLSMEEEPVLALILQTIWQIGPAEEADKKSNWVAHQDFFENDDICQEFMDLLNDVVEANKSNFSRPCVLLGAVAITVRIVDLNERMLEKGFKMLQKWRKLIKLWTVKIEEQMQNEQAHGVIKDLEATLLIISICSALTYNFSPGKKWSYVMENEEDVLRWLHTLHMLHQKASIHGQSLSKFMQVLLEYVQSIPLKLYLENEAITNPLIKNALIMFVSERWGKARECKNEVEISYKLQNSDQKNLVELNYQLNADAAKHKITFDFVLGTFLVNGFPLSHLPRKVTEEKTFKRFFGISNSRIVVQPESNSVFRTVHEYHGAHYEFWTLAEMDPMLKSNVVIIEIKTDVGKQFLLEPDAFLGIVQNEFVHEYTHWLNSRGEVYFRKLCSKESEYSLEPDYKLIKDSTNTWLFFELKHSSNLLSVKSTGFKNIADYLKRLELPSYINVLYKEKDAGKFDLKVSLPRFKLNFKVDISSNRLESKDYPGYFITGEPEGKTLIRLQQGLELKNGEKRVLLIPHGNIKLEPGTYQHSTNIDLKELHEPPYFKYEYDEVLRRLVGNKSKLPYLYLAGLHAVTSLSSGHPDPFTGVTGTEMAMRILQSGFIWSSKPYDYSSLSILEFIRNLAPNRTYYGGALMQVGKTARPGGMEMIDWPKILPSMAAYDGFAILVDNLITESNKLAKLNGNEKAVLKERLADKELQLRGYWSHIKYYNDLARLDPSYESSLASMKCKISAIKDKMSFPANFGKFCNIVYKRFNHSSISKSPQFNPNSLTPFICSAFEFQMNAAFLKEAPSTIDILRMDIKTNWFWLYQLAKNTELAETFTLILGILTYKGAPLEQVLNLHYISKLAEKHQLPDIPETLPKLRMKVPLDGPTNIEIQMEFKSILNKNITNWVLQDFEKTIQNFEIIIDNIVEQKASDFKNIYVATRPALAGPEFKTFGKLNEYSRLFNANQAIKQISDQIDRWHREKALRDFANAVQVQVNRKLEFAEERAQPTFKNNGIISEMIIGGNGKETDIFNSSRSLLQLLSYSSLDKNLLTETNAILRRENRDPRNFEKERVNLETQGKNIIAIVNASIHRTKEARILKLANLSPRLDPTTLLQQFLKAENIGESRNKKELEDLKRVFAALAVTWTKLKQIDRCIAYQSSGQTPELERELENIRDPESWNVIEHPEWICLELELDIRIRRKQVEVALQMMQMPDGGNGVMQLNMGEGKTSVIVPMLCCALGGNGKLCRVTILASMLNMNDKILSFAIGGLLNKRVYIMPCRRDMEIDFQTVEIMKHMYLECLNRNGVVLALPEHRLSFRLLGYDNLLKKDFSLGKILWEVENWLRDRVRDVMDESDELFYVKNQLIYTIGEKIGLDGNQLRWDCCQKILKIVQKVSPDLRSKCGEEKIEYNTVGYFDKPHQFTSIRLLDDSVYKYFISIVADNILDEFTLGRSQKPDVKRFLTENVEDSELLERVLGYFNEDKNQLKQILTYSGYLRRGILTLGLSKRWRVEYGVDSNKTVGLMAVPFRAKDFPAERTEFGHPDLAILLTHLSYYYSGLTDKQLEDVVEFLKKRPSSESIYGSWMETLQMGAIPGHLSTLNGINLKDSLQRNDLFQILRHHTLVINFWLSHKVFPRECKQFPSKLVMTPWDLCFERNRYPTTGFSGTNDSSILLPLQITQQDLTSLLETNNEMERTLLQPENNGHRTFKMGVTCKEILEAMTKDNLRVLIDAGALMLDLDNEQVAKAWLELDSTLEGVLYFNKKNDLTVKIRGTGRQRMNLDIPLELTPYQGSLDKIGVFLDDQHTRGTDLKFPTEWRAVVTIGARMRRDKLIQACMRMRKLGKDQSVTFYLSMEVFCKINEMIKEKSQSSSSFFGKPANPEITTEAVLEWVKRNTKSFNDDGLLYWAIAGKNYAQRLAAEDIFNEALKSANGEINTEALSILASQCVDDEVIQLMDMYGKLTSTDTLVSFIPDWFNSSWSKLTRLNKKRDTFASVALKKFEMIQKGVVGRCQERIPKKLHVCSSDGDMEEEEERELELQNEVEAEEEQHVQRPRKNEPAPHIMREGVTKIVQKGEKVAVQEGIERLTDIFKRTSFFKQLQSDAWSPEVFATTDFISVVKDLNCATDSFLRPLEYFVIYKAASKTKTGKSFRIKQVLFLSPFEVNELFPCFRKKDSPVTLHMFALRRSETQSLLWDNPKLVLPDGQSSTPWTLPDITMSSILLSSGNLYFRTMDEQKSFAAFLCLALKPWGEEEEKAFEAGKITKAGFMLPGYTGRSDFHDGPIKSFQTDPSDLVYKILNCRHSTPSLIAHVMRILREKTFIDLK